MTTSKNVKSENSEKVENSKNLNLNSLKKNLSMNKEKFTKESSNFANSSLYKEEFQSKSIRSKIRNKLDKFASDILGKDRSENERIEAIKDFLSFYKHYWKIQDFKIENFSNSRNASKMQDYKLILEIVKNSLS